jgi:hypothetical protein
MQPNVTHVGGFLKSSFFSTLIFFNFIITICFIVMIAVQSTSTSNIPQTEAIEQNPLQQRVSGETAQLIKLQ